MRMISRTNRGNQEKHSIPNGPVPRSLHLPRSSESACQEAERRGVRAATSPSQLKIDADIFLRFMFDNTMPMSNAVEAYDLFDKMKVHKVVFHP